MSNTKTYITTALTLGIIGVCAALAIGGVNLLTKDKIKKNEIVAQQNALKEIYSNADKFSDAKNDFSLTDSQYLVNYYIAFDNSNNEIGYIYYVDGRNAYGEIALMVGINNFNIDQISVVINTESYATTLEDNYINPFINKEDGASLEDVKCGATYGAKLILNMTNEALQDYILKKGGK